MNLEIQRSETDFSEVTKVALAFLFIGCSFLVFNVGGYNSFIPSDLILLSRFAVVVILFIPTFILFRLEGTWNKYWKLSFSFWISSVGMLLAWFFGRWYQLIPGLSTSTVPGVAVAKVSEVLPIISAILVGMYLVDKDFSSIYLRGGDLRKSIKLGLIASFAALIPFVLVGGLGLTVTPSTILAWIPWMCVFAASNAFMEELMIRGIFLRKYESIFGERQSLLLTSIIFAIFHQAIIGYTDFISFSVFMGMTFFLGLIWGYVIQKSDNIWGAVFAHTIADIFFVLAVFGV
ncbi:MAG: CPBP family intramembrane metalloprotease [Candidatus Thorarchaeota archaeon]|jgi:membrane protease YdiL (CAAX protease family)